MRGRGAHAGQTGQRVGEDDATLNVTCTDEVE